MQTCSNCDFAVKIEGDAEGYFQCRRYPLAFTGLEEDGEPVVAFPVTEPELWCGEWKPAISPFKMEIDVNGVETSYYMSDGYIHTKTERKETE